MATPRQIRRRSRWSLIVGTILAALTFGTVAFADVTATPYNANAGDTVQITGNGMNANESVRVDVNYPDGTLAQEHFVQADGSGNFADSYTIKDTDPSGIYDVTATGQTSGIVFTTTFDPTKNVTTTTTLNLSSSSITIGDSITLSGTLSWTNPIGLNHGDQTRDGRTIHLARYTSAGCGGSGTTIQDVTTSGGGNYSFSPYTPASPGTQYIEASFAGFDLTGGTGTDSYKSSHSGCMELDVNLIATSLGETLTLSTITYGESTAISGTSTGIPASSSIAVDSHAATNCSGGGTAIGTPTTDGGGSWDSLTYTPTGAGSRGILASYAGDTTHASATACQALTVNKAPTFVVGQSLTSNNIAPGDTTIVDYKVESGYGEAANNAHGTTSVLYSGPGTLTCAGGGSFNVAALDAHTSGASADGFGFTVNSGTNTGFRFSCSADTAGTYQLHVHNTGDSNYAAGDGSDIELDVLDPVHPTSTSVSCTPSSVAVNDTTTCTATVTDTSGSPTTPSGTVDTWASTGSGSFSASSCTLASVSTGVASCDVGYVPDPGSEGTHGIIASYEGDDTHASSDSGEFDVTATQRATSMHVSCLPASILLNGTTTCTATVNDTTGGTKITPTGDVTLSTGSTGTFTGNPCTLSQVSGGVASCSATYEATVVGSHTITGSYPGDTDHSGSSDAVGSTVSVLYNLCLLYDPTKPYKAGSTAPLKFYLCDVNGAGDYSDPGFVVNAVHLHKVSTAIDTTVTDSGNANGGTDNNFRFDGTLGPGGGYIFNLSTKSPSPALGGPTTSLTTGTWQLTFTVDGQTGYLIEFEIK